MGVFHLGTPKTAFLMRNSHMDTLILGIYPNNQGHSFQFKKNIRGGLPFLQLHLEICLIQLHVNSLLMYSIIIPGHKGIQFINLCS